MSGLAGDEYRTDATNKLTTVGQVSPKHLPPKLFLSTFLKIYLFFTSLKILVAPSMLR